jgi:hypothetical protein
MGRFRGRLRSRFLTLATLVALTVVGFGVMPPSCGTGDESPQVRYKRIHKGMAESQVEAILGGPSGIYDDTMIWFPLTALGAENPDGSHSGIWYYPGFNVCVWFDPAGRVTWKYSDPFTPPTLLERVEAWLSHLSFPFPWE